MKFKNNNTAILMSALSEDGQINQYEDIMSWIHDRRDSIKVAIEQVPLTELDNWNLDEKTGDIVHRSGKFFSIEGLGIKTDWGNVSEWEQPIINQPEVGILGILSKKINGVLHFLMQAKIEPGNINTVQISPTLQATKSNYTQVHKGNKPLFLDYFNGTNKVEVLLDQLQSEQGGRFLKKRNRNIIIKIKDSENIEFPKDFIWLTLKQIKDLMREDNIVNMDTRTVISGISYDYDPQLLDDSSFKDNMVLLSALETESSALSFNSIISWTTNLKSKYELSIEKIPLRNARDWIYTNDEIYHETRKYFSVIGVRSTILNREVVSWDQPMIKPAQEGLMAFIIKPINGLLHFLVQAKLEVGNFDIIEFAPTVQCLTGNYRKGSSEYSVPFINEVLNAPSNKIVYSSLQSEEGGRFYFEQNKNILILEDDSFNPKLLDNYCWMSFGQVLQFIQFNNYFNIAARSLISAISPIDLDEN
mgnify:FL=1|tara:strand:- start:8233 stop:9654 length:1422 start_codon:yes stop_codon:yes gene_type:complete